MPDQVSSKSPLHGEKGEELQFAIVIMNSLTQQIMLPGLSRHSFRVGQEVGNLKRLADPFQPATFKQFGFSFDFATCLRVKPAPVLVVSFRQFDHVPALKRHRFKELQTVRATTDQFEQRIAGLNVFHQQKVCFGVGEVAADSVNQQTLDTGVGTSQQPVSGQAVAFQIPGRTEFLLTTDRLGNQHGDSDRLAAFLAGDQRRRATQSVTRKTQLSQNIIRMLTDPGVSVVFENRPPGPVISGEMPMERLINGMNAQRQRCFHVAGGHC